MKAVVAAFNQEKALVGAFSVITNLRMELFQALISTHSFFAKIFFIHSLAQVLREGGRGEREGPQRRGDDEDQHGEGDLQTAAAASGAK